MDPEEKRLHTEAMLNAISRFTYDVVREELAKGLDESEKDGG